MTFTIEIELPQPLLRQEARIWLDNHFMSNRYFDITLIRQMVEHLNIGLVQRTRVFVYLESLHCVDFNKMHPETLKKCKEICYALIGDPVDKPVYFEDDLV